jgi:hypothetical protein
MPARQPFGICHSITIEALPQILGLAHIEHDPGNIAHEVNAGTFG